MQDLIQVTPSLFLHPEDIEMTAMRSQGAGGQNVNKVNSAIHLRFDINSSKLPEHIKHRLLTTKDSRITRDGVFVLKAQQHRSQDMNRDDAQKRLVEWIAESTRVQKYRVATKPTRASKKRRLDSKTKQSKQKSLRGKVSL